jgi:MFS family permease
LAGRVQRERWAVSALFLTNGALFATVLPRLPEIKADLALSDGRLGLALLGVGLGGLAGSTASRWLLPRVGSRLLAVGCTVLLALLVPLIGLAPSGAALFAVLLLVGVSDALTDVAMNVSGIEAQRRLQRPVLSSMHAIWSIGAVLGGLIGSAAAGLRVPVPLHVAAVAVVLACLVLAVARVVPDHSGAGEGEPTGARFSPALALLCLLAVCAAVVEDAPASWSAVYLVEHTGAPAGAAGLAFTAFMAAMVAGRLVGDRLVARFGLVQVVRVGGTAAGLALAGGLLVGTTTAAIVAFGVVGLGAASLFPALFTAAGALPGQGVAVMNATARLGFLLSPPVVGAAADSVGLPLALGLVSVPAALAVALLAGAVRPALR